MSRFKTEWLARPENLADLPGQWNDKVPSYHASVTYRAGSWTKPRRVIAKIEWHPGEFCMRVGLMVTKPATPAERQMRRTEAVEMRLDQRKATNSSTARETARQFSCEQRRLRSNSAAMRLAQWPWNSGDVGDDREWLPKTAHGLNCFVADRPRPLLQILSVNPP